MKRPNLEGIAPGWVIAYTSPTTLASVRHAVVIDVEPGAHAVKVVEKLRPTWIPLDRIYLARNPETDPTR